MAPLRGPDPEILFYITKASALGMVHIKYEAGILNGFGDIRIQKTLTKTFNICVTGADAYADADADTNRRLSTILVSSKIGQSLPFLYIPLDNLYKAI